MKILFVCKSNIARSQMAAAIYNKLTNTLNAESAGLNVTNKNETLGERKARIGESHTLTVMRQNGYDLSNNTRHQLTQAMVNEYDLIIGLLQAKEEPDWLVQSHNYVSWNIADPFGGTLDDVRATKDILVKKIYDFIQK